MSWCPSARFVSNASVMQYLQAMEGGIDSSHVSFLHSGALQRDPLFAGAKGNQYNLRDTAPASEVEPFDGGLLIGARRNADHGRYYWRITPWVMPFFTLVPPRGGHPLNGHGWVPIDDEHCWTWSISYHPRRALTGAEIQAMQAGSGIHVKYVPGSFVRANKANDYLWTACTEGGPQLQRVEASRCRMRRCRKAWCDHRPHEETSSPPTRARHGAPRAARCSGGEPAGGRCRLTAESQRCAPEPSSLEKGALHRGRAARPVRASTPTGERSRD